MNGVECIWLIYWVECCLLCRFAWGEDTIRRLTVTRDTFSGPVSQSVDILVTPAVVVRGHALTVVVLCTWCTNKPSMWCIHTSNISFCIFTQPYLTCNYPCSGKQGHSLTVKNCKVWSWRTRGAVALHWVTGSSEFWRCIPACACTLPVMLAMGKVCACLVAHGLWSNLSHHY